MSLLETAKNALRNLLAPEPGSLVRNPVEDLLNAAPPALKPLVRDLVAVEQEKVAAGPQWPKVPYHYDMPQNSAYDRYCGQLALVTYRGIIAPAQTAEFEACAERTVAHRMEVARTVVQHLKEADCDVSFAAPVLDPPVAAPVLKGQSLKARPPLG